MDKMETLWNSMSSQAKAKLSQEEFKNAILYLEMKKLSESGLLENRNFNLNELKDFIYNKIQTNLDNIIPGAKDKCMIKYCRQKNIKASHVISKTFLKNICDATGKHKGCLYVPKGNIVESKLKITPLGVGVSFRFPGFCEKHENWFEFEKKKDMVTNKDSYKQIFRSICYEKYIQARLIELEVRLKEIFLREVIKKTNDFVNSNSIIEIKIESLKNSQTEIYRKATKKSIRERRQLIMELDKFYNVVNQSIKKDEGRTELCQIKFSLTIPVAYTHCGKLNLLLNKRKSSIFAANILIPLPTGSLLIIATTSQYRKQLGQLSRLLQDEKNVNGFIFNTISQVTDNWLVQPYFWNNGLSNALKSKILTRSSVYE